MMEYEDYRNNMDWILADEPVSGAVDVRELLRN